MLSSTSHTANLYQLSLSWIANSSYTHRVESAVPAATVPAVVAVAVAVAVAAAQLLVLKLLTHRRPPALSVTAECESRDSS
jgi:hypothetical protein